MSRALGMFIMVLGLLASIHSEAFSRTWYVKVDGTGDAPAIHAAMDSAAYGDTILVGPGTYVLTELLWLKSGVKLISESGPANTIIQPDNYWNFVGITIREQVDIEISGFWIKPMRVSTIDIGGANNIIVSNNIIESDFLTFAALDLDYSDFVYIYNNLILGDGYSIYLYYSICFLQNNIVKSLYCEQTIIGDSSCNDILGSSNCDAYNDFNLDPQFCGIPGSDNYYLQSDSPCAPGNDPVGGYCGLIGPLPVGCSTVDVENKSWGEIKAIYRE
jgi:hypothetical protein